MNQGATMQFSLNETDDSFAAGGMRYVRLSDSRTTAATAVLLYCLRFLCVCFFPVDANVPLG